MWSVYEWSVWMWNIYHYNVNNWVFQQTFKNSIKKLDLLPVLVLFLKYIYIYIIHLLGCVLLRVGKWNNKIWTKQKKSFNKNLITLMTLLLLLLQSEGKLSWHSCSVRFSCWDLLLCTYVYIWLYFQVYLFIWIFNAYEALHVLN